MNAHAAARDGWLAHATAVLREEPNVVGVALVGSLGRGDGDDWSDVDLLVFVDGEPRGALEDAILELGTIGLRIAAPHNTRPDADSFGIVFLVDDLPVTTDWYVSHAALARWPSDATPIVGAQGLLPVGRTFEAMNGEGPRGAAPAWTDEDRRRGALYMTIVHGKRIARDGDEVPLPDLRQRVHELSEAGPDLAVSIDGYLDLVAETIGRDA